MRAESTSSVGCWFATWLPYHRRDHNQQKNASHLDDTEAKLLPNPGRSWTQHSSWLDGGIGDLDNWLVSGEWWSEEGEQFSILRFVSPKEGGLKRWGGRKEALVKSEQGCRDVLAVSKQPASPNIPAAAPSNKHYQHYVYPWCTHTHTRAERS